MTNSPQTAGAPQAQAIEVAFDALRNYHEGSGRAALLPLDRAVASAAGPDRKRIEQRLLAALQSSTSAVALEYICSKLALLGSDSAVPALAALLSEAQLATAARNALESLPVPSAARALRNSLPKLENALKIGAINSLGARRDPEAVSALARLLRGSDAAVKQAAAAALGNIGSVKAARALQVFWAQAPKELRQPAADAMLVCAGHLESEGHKSKARDVYTLLKASALATHIAAAATRGLQKCDSGQ